MVINSDRQPKSIPLIRLVFASLIGVGIGYYIYFALDQEKEVKGTICLVIDDFGFAHNSMVEDFFHLNQNITAAIIPGAPYTQSIGDYAVDGKFWQFLAYCAGTGGSVLIIGSAAGVAVMGILKVDFIWYMKRISLLALMGYLAGAATYILIQ